MRAPVASLAPLPLVERSATSRRYTASACSARSSSRRRAASVLASPIDRPLARSLPVRSSSARSLRRSRDGRGVRVLLLAAQEVPGDHRQLSGDGDDRDVPAAPGGDPLGEGVQWTGRSGGDPGRLDEDLTGDRGTLLADPAVAGRVLARLVHPRIEAEICDQPAGRPEAVDVTDDGDERGGGRPAYARQAHQPTHLPETDSDTRLVTGPRRDIGEQTLRKEIEAGTLDREHCEEQPAVPDDVLMLEPGTLDAIGAGAFVYEIEQPSDLALRTSD